VTELAPADRVRLVNILGMLGSEHDGERASAGLLASRMLRDRGLQWIDLIGTPKRQIGVPPSYGATWRADLTLAQRHVSFTRPWERTFIASVSQRHSLTPKQRLVLREIAAALRQRGLS
jgi:hypothetical protein